MAYGSETLVDPQQQAVLQKAKQMLAGGMISEDEYNRIVTQFSPVAQISKPMGNADPDIDTTKIGPDRSLAANQRTMNRSVGTDMATSDAARWRYPILGGQ